MVLNKKSQRHTLILAEIIAKENGTIVINLLDKNMIVYAVIYDRNMF